jgi:hypothetical protein
MTCPTPRKRVYRDPVEAHAAAARYARRDDRDPLEPYPCGAHWHLRSLAKRHRAKSLHRRDPETRCAPCGGFLTYTAGHWRHLNLCPECWQGNSCPDHRPRQCPDPEPVLCTHNADWRCDQPAGLLLRCAYERDDHTCCGCCWATAADA